MAPSSAGHREVPARRGKSARFSSAAAAVPATNPSCTMVVSQPVSAALRLPLRPVLARRPRWPRTRATCPSTSASASRPSTRQRGRSLSRSPPAPGWRIPTRRRPRPALARLCPARPRCFSRARRRPLRGRAPDPRAARARPATRRSRSPTRCSASSTARSALRRADCSGGAGRPAAASPYAPAPAGAIASSAAATAAACSRSDAVTSHSAKPPSKSVMRLRAGPTCAW